MSVSTFQKLTIVSCVALCVALLLPKMLLSRAKRDADTDGPAGQFPPLARGSGGVEDPQRSRTPSPRAPSSRSHQAEAVSRARGSGSGKSLAAHVIPIYGFGILLYILYILIKITSRGKTTKPPESRLSAIRSENTKRKITDFELLQLQERLNDTRDMIERIISSAPHSSGVCVDEEQTLLLQLQEIARVMQDGRLLECEPADRFTDAHGPASCCAHTHTHTSRQSQPHTHTHTSSQSQPHTHTGSDSTLEQSCVRQRLRP